MNRTPKPHGRLQASPVKDRILAALAKYPNGVGAPQISIDIGVDRKNVRQHLIELQDEQRAKSRAVALGNLRRIVWGLPGADLDNQPESPLGGVIDQLDAENMAWPQRTIIPAGAWRADHMPGPRSVFDLGVAA